MYLYSSHRDRSYVCSQGIGKCTAELFAREGAFVTITDLDAGKQHDVYLEK